MECIIKPVICDVFVSNSASGNPAAVVELDAWISDNELLNITKTLKQPITAFVVNDLGTYYIRWFSLSGEINLCGHGSLAAGAVMLARYSIQEINFQSQHGEVSIAKVNDGYCIVLPSWPATFPAKYEEATESISESTDLFSTRDLVVVLSSIESVKNFKPDYEKVARMKDHHALMVTAQDGDSGYVLRYFAPKIGIDEDMATGSAQCSLAPYWFARLGRERLQVNQLSQAGGYFEVEKLSEHSIKLLAKVNFQ